MQLDSVPSVIYFIGTNWGVVTKLLLILTTRIFVQDRNFLFLFILQKCIKTKRR